MLTIQQVGTEILGGNPGKFYALTGEEYGIKQKYIQALESHYGQLYTSDSVSDVLNSMQSKQLFPPKPGVYVVRYDEEFIKNLDKATSSYIHKSNIYGTVICIYESTKHEQKLEKYLSEFTVRVPKVDKRFIRKYLVSDIPGAPDELLDIATELGQDYMSCKLIANSLNGCAIEDVLTYKHILESVFNVSDRAEDAQVKLGVASRSFRYLMSVCDRYVDDIDKFIYTMLSAILEIEKLINNSYAESTLREYVKLWSLSDVYNMYMHVYDQILKSRSIGKSSRDTVCYLAGLLQFDPVPSLEEMRCY